MSNKQKEYSFEEVVNIYNAMISKYNNDLHSRIKGKTRIEVLQQKQNPKSVELPMPIIAKSFGYETMTSLRRSQYVRVQYANYQLPSPEFIRKIDKKSRLIAYYLPEEDGTIEQVYLYQNGNYIAECKKIEKYNEARSEWADKDAESYMQQASYVARFDKMEKEEEQRIFKLGILPKSSAIEEEEIESIIYEEKEEEIDETDYQEVYVSTEKDALNY